MLLKVLIVEDDDISAFLSTRLLEKKKRCSQIHVAKNGQEALDYLVACGTQGLPYPNIILLDVTMPIMDAYEFLDHFGKMVFVNKEKTFLVLLSTNPGRIKEERDNLIVAQMVKPLTMEKVEELFDLWDSRTVNECQ